MKFSQASLLPQADECRAGSTSAGTYRMSEKCRHLAHAPKTNEWNTWHSGSDDALSDLHTQMAHIQWRKHTNDKNIRRALDITKYMHDRDLMIQLGVDRQGQRERWTEAITSDEISRTTDISKALLECLEQREEEYRKRQLKETKLHLKSIKRVERTLSVKKETEGKLKSHLDKEYTIPVEDGRQRILSRGEIKDSSVELKEKLRALRKVVKGKRRELIGAGKKGFKRIQRC